MAKGKKAGQAGRTGRSDMRSDGGADAADDGATIFDNIRDDAYLIVWWVDPTGKLRLQFKIAPHMLSEEYIQAACGGGEYVIREKVPDPESGRMEWGRQRKVVIDGPHKPLTQIPVFQPKQSGAANAPAPAPPGTSIPGRVDINDVMTAGILNLFKTQQEANDALVRVMQQPRDNGMKEIIVLLAPALMELAKGFNAKREPVEGKMSDIREVAEVMKSLKDVAGTPSHPANEFIDMISRVLKLKRELGEDDDGPDLGGTPMERVFERLAGPIADALGGQRPQATPVRRALPTGGKAPVVGSLAPTKEGPTSTAVEDLFVATQKKRLISLAMRNKDAVLLAEADFEALPENYLGPLKSWLGTEGCFEALMAKVPEFQPHQEWLAVYFETMHREFFPEQYAEETDDEPDMGGSADGPQDERGPANPASGAASEAV